MRPQRQPGHDVVIGPQAHVDEPIDRQHQEHEIDARTTFGSDARSHQTSLRRSSWVMMVKKIQQTRQRDEVVDERHRRGVAEVDLAERDLDEIDREERRGAAGAAAGHDERLGVDHEGLHEAQQHRDDRAPSAASAIRY